MFNVYNGCRSAEREGAAVNLLLTHGAFDQPELYVSDFNMHHKSWSLTTPTSSCRRTADWIDRCNEYGCEMAGPFGEATHRAGGVLDLAWATAEARRHWPVSCRVAPEAANTSDHTPILTTIGGAASEHRTPSGRYRVDTANSEVYRKVLEDQRPLLEATTMLSELATVEDAPNLLDDLASAVTETIRGALAQATTRSSTAARGYPWWNQECREATRRYRDARRLPTSDDQ